jgi:hypothetical protein
MTDLLQQNVNLKEAEMENTHFLLPSCMLDFTPTYFKISNHEALHSTPALLHLPQQPAHNLNIFTCCGGQTDFHTYTRKLIEPSFRTDVHLNEMEMSSFRLRPINCQKHKWIDSETAPPLPRHSELCGEKKYHE